MEFFSHQTNFPFMATRRVWYALSAVLMLVSLGSLLTRGLNFAIVLTLGIATSMFTSLMGSRALLTLMYGGQRKIARLSI